MTELCKKEDLDDLTKLVANSENLDEKEKEHYNYYRLRRFLIMAEDPNKAYAAILKNAQWRKEYGVEKLSPETDEYIRTQLADAHKLLIFDNKYDNEGRPVVYVRIRYFNVYERNIEDYRRLLAYMFETTAKLTKDELIDNTCVIYDLKGFSLNNLDYPAVKSILWLFLNHYPESIGISLVLNAPFFVKPFWMIIKGWIPEKYQSSVVFTNMNEIGQYIDPEYLPAD